MAERPPPVNAIPAAVPSAFSAGTSYTQRMVFRAVPALLLTASLHGQTAPDPADILAHARYQIVAAMQRLPKYACVQTIDRSYYVRHAAQDSCDQIAADQRRGRTELRLHVTDRVRLDVAQGDGQENHSLPGADRFETGDIDELIKRGPAATGSIGGYLIDIFDGESAQFDFAGERVRSDRHVFTYAYRVPELTSHYKVRTGEGWAIAAYDGTFDVDTATLELLRITINTAQLPQATGMCQAETALVYSRVRLGDEDFLLPTKSRLHLVHPGTLQTDSDSAFTSCREYRPDASAAPEPKRGAALPPGILIKLRFDAAIDSNTSAAGDPVTATVTGDTGVPNGVLRSGAVAHGRVTRTEHWLFPKPQFIVGILWESITWGDSSIPFAALPAPPDGQVSQPPGVGRLIPARLPAYRIANETLLLSTEKRFLIPAGEERRWITVSRLK